MVTYLLLGSGCTFVVGLKCLNVPFHAYVPVQRLIYNCVVVTLKLLLSDPLPLCRKLEDLSVDEFLQSGLDSGGDEDSGDEGSGGEDSGDEQPKQNGVQKKAAGKTTDTDE